MEKKTRKTCNRDQTKIKNYIKYKHAKKKPTTTESEFVL